MSSARSGSQNSGLNNLCNLWTNSLGINHAGNVRITEMSLLVQCMIRPHEPLVPNYIQYIRC
jgi:hypothetical protein